MFWVNLKTCLGLVLTTLSLSGKSEAGFWVIFLWAMPKPLWSLLCSTIVLYNIYTTMTRTDRLYLPNRKEHLKTLMLKTGHLSVSVKRQISAALQGKNEIII